MIRTSKQRSRELLEPFLSKRAPGLYRSDVAAAVNGKGEAHVVPGDPGSAERVVQVHVIAVIAERGQVGCADHDGHVV